MCVFSTQQSLGINADAVVDSMLCQAEAIPRRVVPHIRRRREQTVSWNRDRLGYSEFIRRILGNGKHSITHYQPTQDNPHKPRLLLHPLAVLA